MSAISSNFDFLEQEFLLLHNLGKAAEHNLLPDPGTSLKKLRQFAQPLTELIYETFGLDFPEDNGFISKLQKLRSENIYLKMSVNYSLMLELRATK